MKRVFNDKNQNNNKPYQNNHNRKVLPKNLYLAQKVQNLIVMELKKCKR